MKITQTGIAVALALAVIIMFFVLPGLWPFGNTQSAQQTTEINVPPQNTQTNPMPTVDALQVTDEILGTGETAVAGANVTVNYVGALTNGQVFDAFANHGTTGFTFKLGAGQVIKGWDDGVAGMKVGGKRKLVIPASLAYGDQGAGNVIPPGATLVFEVELLNVSK